MAADWFTLALALAVLVVPMLMAWALLSWSDRPNLKENAKDNRPRSPNNSTHGKHH